MSYKIVVDSCCELPPEYQGDVRFERVPLGLEVGDYQILDDEHFDQAEFLEKVAAYPKCPKSSCPSPERYMNAYETEAEDVYVVTLSSHLSGSHQSAVLGKNLYEEAHGQKNIHIVDSQSASCGETQIAMKLMELAANGMPFAQVREAIERFRDEMNTYFVLDNLETLRKNGRLTGVKAMVASTLNIKPVMGADRGTIIQRGQGIGIKKALAKMTDLIAEELKDGEKKVIRIAHCNCLERANQVRELLVRKVKCKGIEITETAGISSMYANDGGIIVAV